MTTTRTQLAFAIDGAASVVIRVRVRKCTSDNPARKHARRPSFRFLADPRQLPLWDADAFAFIDDRIERYRRPAISNGRRLSKRELRFKAELDRSNELAAFPMPTSDEQCRAIGLGEDFPCPFAKCRHHLGIDIMEKRGSLRVIYPHWEDGADESVPTCSLAFARNVAPGEETPPEQIAKHLGIGKNLVGRVLCNALAKLGARLNMTAAELQKALEREKEERDGEQRRA